MAPGFRDAESNRGAGALHSVGINGFSWSSTVSGSNVRFLDFHPTWLEPQDGNSRGNGFPLRFLHE